MGVKLQNILVRHDISYQDLAGKIIAVDAPNIIMGLFNFARKISEVSDTSLILDRTQRPISHLYGLLYRISFYYSRKIFPIFCFDGKVSELKRIVSKDQLKDFIFTQKWYKRTLKDGNKILARQIALSKEYLWQNIIQESKQLLGALGVPYIDSPASAESQCAYLVKKGISHFSNSQDFDSILFGCPSLLQNLSKSLRRKVQGKWQYQKIQPLFINLQRNLKNLNLSLFQLIDIGILIGTDYFPGIIGIGPKKGLMLIRKYKNIEILISKEYHKYNFHELTTEIIKRVRKIFLFPEVLESLDNIHWNLPNKTRVMELLCREHHLNKNRVNSNLITFEKHYKTCREYFIFKKDCSKPKQAKLDYLL